jgi:predicted acetyltransferase
MTLKISKATLNDIEPLAEMNKQLIEDEGSRNPMNNEQLKERMKGMLQGEWKGLIISDEDEILGYMIYKESPDEYYPNQTELYIRQYFIKRQHRSRGIGAQAFKTISSDYFPDNVVLTVDVLEVNPRGKKFWEKIGFKPYLTHMKKQKQS